MTNSQRYQHLVAQAEKSQTVVGGVIFHDVMVNELLLNKIISFLREEDKKFTIRDGIKVYMISRAGFRLGELGPHIHTPEQIQGEKERIQNKGQYMSVGWFEYNEKRYLILNQIRDEATGVEIRNGTQPTDKIVEAVVADVKGIIKNPPH